MVHKLGCMVEDGRFGVYHLFVVLLLIQLFVQRHEEDLYTCLGSGFRIRNRGLWLSIEDLGIVL